MFFNMKTRTGKYRLGIRTSKKKQKLKRRAAKKWLYTEARQLPVPVILERVATVIRGHCNDYGVIGNLFFGRASLCDYNLSFLKKQFESVKRAQLL